MFCGYTSETEAACPSRSDVVDVFVAVEKPLEMTNVTKMKTGSSSSGSSDSSDSEDSDNGKIKSKHSQHKQTTLNSCTHTHIVAVIL